MAVALDEELAVTEDLIGHWSLVIGRLINRFGCGSELAHVIRCAYIGSSFVSGDRSCAVDGMSGGGLVFIPESAVLPCPQSGTLGGAPVGIIAITGFFGEPVAEAVHVVERKESVHEVLDEVILSCLGAGPNGLCVVVHTGRRPVLEVIGALNDMHAFLGELYLQIIDGADQRSQCLLTCVRRGRCEIGMPEGVVTETDDVEIDVVGAQFVVIIEIVLFVAGSVGVNDDLCVRTQFAHGVTTGLEQSEVSVPVVSRLVIGVHLNAAESVHDLIAHLDEIRRSVGGIEGSEHIARVVGYVLCHSSVIAAFPSCRCLDMSGIDP